MKFGKQIEEYELPEWKGHYLPYKQLKKELEKVAHPNGNSHGNDEEQPAASKGLARTSSWTAMRKGSQDVNEFTDREWLQHVESEAKRIGVFVDRGIDGLNQQLEELQKLISESGLAVVDHSEAIDAYASADEESSHMKLHALQALGNVSIGVQRLRAFAELNYAALYKILKKHDKLLKTKFGLEQLFPRLVKETNLASIAACKC